MEAPDAISLIIVGNELLTGKRQDRHLSHAIEILAARGLEPRQCTLVGDHPRRLCRTIRNAMAARDIIFCFGGIGATPDDHTRQAAADAAQMPLVVHAEAKALLEARFGADTYPHRIHMAELPIGSTLIPNPVNQIPGFRINDAHFLPGFPQMAYPMMEWCLDTWYPEMGGPRPVDHLVVVTEVTETDLMDILQTLDGGHPDVEVSSLAHLGSDGRWVEIGLRGQPGYVDAARRELETLLARDGRRWQLKQSA
ncbi:MAG: competence/damage-inducible protein A [Chromatiales bacterium]|nr:competence/damage-inducible protein A [Gammaproteobacteria bacterium]MCP5352743.1 competence/damage-inducible protein A [Chromatiales bacterium]